ncbi:MAG TPA: hypothetical protein VEZ11_11395 [Thermoanaerobaculia bacterium]|nr:hypothetical protein [Thermoanaerobaculia bacterium]
MDPYYRAIFNRQFTDEIYRRYQDELERRLSCRFEFRLAETPLFIYDSFKQKIVDAANAILRQLTDPVRLTQMKRAIPARWDTPGMDAIPNFTQIDFAVVRGAGGALEPKLIELQGFPSLTAMQLVQRDAWRETIAGIDGLDLDWSCWYSGLDRDSFLDLARRTIVGNHDPAEVILMDLDPPRQKTYPDFAATKLLFGVDPVDPTSLIRRGRELYRRSPNGTEVRVRRIYNRVVFDELLKKGTALPFDFRDELDVEWAPHPNWYWVWSKYSLPFLDHPAVPRARFVSEVESLPEDLAARYVLKPLFSFAGGGVNVEPTAADVAAIPESERVNWCLQEKIEYEPALQAADGGGVKIEIRMMFLRPHDAANPVLAQNLVRLSRGKMLGVDFNKQFTWVGSSVGLSASS